MWKLERYQRGDFLVLVLCGQIEQEELGELQKILEAEAEGQKVALDLDSVRLVDQHMVKFLARCEKKGIRLDNCPVYVREWISRGNTRARRLDR
jgi:ABC-type transporter Mla MlaB component